MSASYLWHFVLGGYLLSILIETPILLVGLSRRHSFGRRLFAGVWLTACTYPIVVLVMPILMQSFSRWQYLLVAETFAPVTECLLFASAFHHRRDPTSWAKLQDLITIILANLASFGAGELIFNRH